MTINRRHFKVAVIGGGCLGGAAAISLAQRLGGGSVCLLEKSVIGAGASSRHSGIVRASNRSERSAQLGQWALTLWQDIGSVWGAVVPNETTGALWIAPAEAQTDIDAWNRLVATQKKVGIAFDEIDEQQARTLTCDRMRFSHKERYFFEPHCYLYRPVDVLDALNQAFAMQGVAVYENTTALAFKTELDKRITEIKTTCGSFTCDYVVNAAGAWSGSLFETIGLTIPIIREAMYAVNWLLSARAIPRDIPIVADFQHLVYFRRWESSIMHMHQPRGSDAGKESVAAVADSRENDGWQLFRSPSSLLKCYRDVLKARFPHITEPVYAGGHLAYFDTTPDKELIVGFDPQVPNLVHCLGAGQAFKFAPALGELVAELIITGSSAASSLDLSTYSIARFDRVDRDEVTNTPAARRRCL